MIREHNSVQAIVALYLSLLECMLFYHASQDPPFFSIERHTPLLPQLLLQSNEGAGDALKAQFHLWKDSLHRP